MTRVKRGTISLKGRKKILKLAKGYRHGLSSKERQAKTAITHAAMHAFNDRRKKKGVFRRLWTVRINARVREFGLPYNQFIDLLKKKNILLDRKVLSQISKDAPATLERIVAEVKK